MAEPTNPSELKEPEAKGPMACFAIILEHPVYKFLEQTRGAGIVKMATDPEFTFELYKIFREKLRYNRYEECHRFVEVADNTIKMFLEVKHSKPQHQLKRWFAFKRVIAIYNDASRLINDLLQPDQPKLPFAATPTDANITDYFKKDCPFEHRKSAAKYDILTGCEIVGNVLRISLGENKPAIHFEVPNRFDDKLAKFKACIGLAMFPDMPEQEPNNQSYIISSGIYPPKFKLQVVLPTGTFFIEQIMDMFKKGQYGNPSGRGRGGKGGQAMGRGGRGGRGKGALDNDITRLAHYEINGKIKELVRNRRNLGLYIAQCCATAGEFVILQKNAGDPDAIRCPGCAVNICTRCGATVYNLCECNYDNEIIDPATYRLMKEGGVNKCPNCKSLVSKTDGCNHMTCTCGMHFCWECGEQFGFTVGLYNGRPFFHNKDIHFTETKCTEIPI